MELSIEQKREICELLSVKSSYAEWLTVKDSDDELVMLTLNDRYLDLTSDPVARTIRGLVWSVPQKRIVCATGVISLIADVNTNELEVDEGMLTFTTSTPVKAGRGKEAASQNVEILHMLPRERCLIMPNYEGVKVNVFLYNGRVYYATNGNLYIFGRKDEGTAYTGGWWRHGSITYGQQFELMLGPRERIARMLFPEVFQEGLEPEERAKLNSPWCTSVYLCHPSSFLCTTLKTGNQGFCIWYGHFNSGSVPIEREPYDFGAHFAAETGIEVVDRYPYSAANPPTKPFVINASDMLHPNRSALLNDQEANLFLKYGLPDPNQASREFFDAMYTRGKWPLVPGESLTVTYLPEPTLADPDPIYQRFRLRSPSFAYRERIHEHTNQFYQRFVALVQNGSHRLLSQEELLEEVLDWVELFPKPADRTLVDQLISRGQPICDAELYLPEEVARLSHDQLVASLAYLYVLISNPHNQGLGTRYFVRFLIDRDHCIEWLAGQLASGRYPDRAPPDVYGKALPEKLVLFYQLQVKRLLKAVKDEIPKEEHRLRSLFAEKELIKRRPQLLLSLVESAVKRLDGRALNDLIRLVSSVKGYNTIQYSDPTAPAVSKAVFPTLGKASSSSKKPATKKVVAKKPAYTPKTRASSSRSSRGAASSSSSRR